MKGANETGRGPSGRTSATVRGDGAGAAPGSVPKGRVSSVPQGPGALCLWPRSAWVALPSLGPFLALAKSSGTLEPALECKAPKREVFSGRNCWVEPPALGKGPCLPESAPGCSGWRLAPLK